MVVKGCTIFVNLQFFEGHMTDLDLLVVGGFYGDGKYQKKISSFLLAIYDEAEGNTINIIR